MQCVAARCSALQRAAVRCSMLQCVAAEYSSIHRAAHLQLKHAAPVNCSALNCVAVCRSTLHCVVLHCVVLPCVAVCCSRIPQNIQRRATPARARDLPGCCLHPPLPCPWPVLNTWNIMYSDSHTYQIQVYQISKTGIQVYSHSRKYQILNMKYRYIHIHINIKYRIKYRYGVATISRLLEIMGLYCTH